MSRTSPSNLSKTAGLSTFFELDAIVTVDGNRDEWSLCVPPGPPPEVVEASEAMEAHGLAGGVVEDAKTKAVLVFVWFSG